MNLAQQLAENHSPGNRFSYYPLSSSWKEVGKLTPNLPSPGQEGYALYIHLPFCKELCTYCGCNIKISQNESEHIQYVQALIAEWELKRSTFSNNPKLLGINFGGGTPNALSPKAQEILNDKLKTLTTPETTFGVMEADPRYFTAQHAQEAYQLNINRISFGVQDFNADILSNVNRRQTHQDIFKAKANLVPQQSFGIDLLWGLPKQNKGSIQKWSDHLKELSPDWISFYPLAKVPWLESIQHAYGDFTLPTREEKYLLYQWGVEIFESLDYINLGMGHFIRKGSALDNAEVTYRKVSGLFTQKINYLMGIGVSAITESEDFLAQNEKVLSRYIYSILNKKKLPIIKYHQKSQSDKMMNKFIEEIFSFNRIPLEIRAKIQGHIPTQWFNAHSGEITPLGHHFKKNIMQISETLFLKTQ